jgi:hypothetical protein
LSPERNSDTLQSSSRNAYSPSAYNETVAAKPSKQEGIASFSSINEKFTEDIISSNHPESAISLTRDP